MTNRKTPLLPGEYFHVYNRGNSKQEIFLNKEDKDRFVKLLYISNSKKNVCFRDDIIEKKIDAWDFERGETLVSIGAWVLMPNHFHIYITSRTPGVRENLEDKEDKTNITLFMHKLCMSYAKYFNKKYNRVGCLFEGPFKSVHVKNDNQAKYLFSYIHLNPVKLIDSKWKENGISNKNLALEYLNAYKWSSYNDHRGIRREENSILQLNNFPKYFSNIKDFDSEIFSWLQYD
ncbi:MAG: hypothetical protein WC793_02420 [Candidatus Paceibacterota bacterium]|jgi:putative transposase